MDPTQPTPTDAAMAFEQIIKAKFSEHIGLYLGPYLVGSERPSKTLSRLLMLRRGVIDCMLWGFMIHQALIWLSSGGEGRWSLKLCVVRISFRTQGEGLKSKGLDHGRRDCYYILVGAKWAIRQIC